MYVRTRSGLSGLTRGLGACVPGAPPVVDPTVPAGGMTLTDGECNPLKYLVSMDDVCHPNPGQAVCYHQGGGGIQYVNPGVSLNQTIQGTSSYQNTVNGQFSQYGFGPGSTYQAPGGWTPSQSDVFSWLDQGVFGNIYGGQGSLIPQSVANAVVAWNQLHPDKPYQLPAPYTNLNQAPVLNPGNTLTTPKVPSVPTGIMTPGPINPPALPQSYVGGAPSTNYTPVQPVSPPVSSNPAGPASQSFIQSIFGPSASPSPSAPASSSGSMLDGITSWIEANPILAGVGALGILFLFSGDRG